MRVREVMTEGVECVRPRDSIAHAAERMRQLNVGSMPVCGEDNQLTGIITDRDITIRATADGCDPRNTCVCDVMTHDIVYGFDDEDVVDAAQLMEQQQIRRLPIMDRDKRLVGILSLGDLAVRGANEELSGEALEAISQPAIAAH